jgi:hypothetical protein
MHWRTCTVRQDIQGQKLNINAWIEKLQIHGKQSQIKIERAHRQCFFQFSYGSNENELSCFIKRALHVHVKMNKALQFALFCTFN